MSSSAWLKIAVEKSSTPEQAAFEAVRLAREFDVSVIFEYRGFTYRAPLGSTVNDVAQVIKETTRRTVPGAASGEGEVKGG